MQYSLRSLSSVFLTFLLLLSACDQAARDGGNTYQMEVAADKMLAEAVTESALPPEEQPGSPDDSEIKTVKENPFVETAQEATSTFSIDVDNASYSYIRANIEASTLPTPEAVRIEEMINYFSYEYPQPQGVVPFSIYTEVADCPWNPAHRLVHIGLQGKKLDTDNLKASNLVFLIDASGSMQGEERLGLVKKSMEILLEQLSAQDRVAIVVYAGAAGLVLPPTPANEKARIMAALNKLEAGGSTAGGEGILLAYKIAEENLIAGGNNRVVLCSDGDFNVGVSSTQELVALMEEKRKKDIYLTIGGYGMGNYQDNRLEAIAQAGNGNYFYLDTFEEAKKVFGKEMRANLFTIAKDVKIQVAFDPAYVAAYRLIGYENRVMANEDFENDLKDAGELGAGHSVTALYEIVLLPGKSQGKVLDLRLRYKLPRTEQSLLLEQSLIDQGSNFAQASENFRFSAAVAMAGLLLKQSQYKAEASFEQAISLAKNARSQDPDAYRWDFVKLLEKAKQLSRAQ